MADDPESARTPRPRRRRAATRKAASEATSPLDPAEPDAPGPSPLPIDDRPLPTFLQSGPRPHDTVAGVPDHLVSAQSREVADRILDGWAVESPVEVTAAPTPSLDAAEASAGRADHGWLPVLDDRSPDPDICPFLRAVDDRDRLMAPVETPDPANRCAALRDAVPQSLRQQELVCLASGHVNCPRYLRGAVVIADAPEPVVRKARLLSPAVFGSLVVLVLAASASVAFVLAGGGLELAAAPATPSPAASATAVAVAPVTPSPTIVSTPTPPPTASPTPSPSPSPTPSPTPTPSPSSTPRPTVQPAAISDRYRLLRQCPGTPRCWIYRVRAGDNLYSIANYFGVSLESIRNRNPWTRTQGLRAGQELRLPPPTR